jgi:hypothetical protein
MAEREEHFKMFAEMNHKKSNSKKVQIKLDLLNGERGI